MNVQVLQGDCVEVLKGFTDNSFDSICTDPPYNLSDDSKRDTYCLRRVVAEFDFPDNHEGDTRSIQGGNLTIPAFSSAFLGSVNRPVRVDTRIGMPESTVDFQNATISEHEIDAGNESAVSPTDRDLTTVNNPQHVKSRGSYILKLADSRNTSFCDATCSCFAEPGNGLIAMSVTLSSATCGNLSGNSLRRRERSDEIIRFADDTGRESEGTTGVLTRGGTEVHAILILDLRRGTGKLRFTDRTGEGDPLFVLELAQSVGAISGTSSFPFLFEAGEVSVVCDSADWAFTLYFPSHSFYSNGNAGNAGGFMGRNWDGFESPASFQRWCSAWASECFRVLKPGGHLLAFGGTRTYHRMACGIEDAGFEVRDSLHHIYGTGFPKSMNVAKAIDKASRGYPQGGSDPQSPNTGKYDRLPSRGAGPGKFAPGLVPHSFTVTDAEALRWEGWGTALKPAHEPVILARKPLSEKTVAANVLKYGTGGINVDACRVATTDHWEATGVQSAKGVSYQGSADGSLNVSVSTTHEAGRWPPNVLLTHAADCRRTGTRQVKTGMSVERNRDGEVHNEVYGSYRKPAREDVTYGIGGLETVEAWNCAEDCPVAEMDRQSGRLKSGFGAFKHASSVDGHGNRGAAYGKESRREGEEMVSYGDMGGASRFFPCFRYQAKASSKQRPHVEGVADHPTVKPVELMRWLVRLVTPPGGTVLDPFAGTGTTGEACLEEGFNCVLIEKEADYLRLIDARFASRHPTLWEAS